MAVNLSGMFQNINQASQFRKPPAQMAQMPDNMLTRSGITNPLLQVFGQGLAGMTGTDLRTPEQIQQAEVTAKQQQQEALKGQVQEQVLTRLNQNPAFTAEEKNMYTSMYLSGDMSEAQVLATVDARETKNQESARIQSIKSDLIGRGYDEKQLNNLPPSEVQNMYKDQIRQDAVNTRAVEGAEAYMSILDLPPDLKERGSQIINSEQWTKLSDAQRSSYFKNLEQEKKVKQQVNYFTTQAQKLPEGDMKDKFLQTVQDLEAGLINPDKVREQLAMSQDPSITETDKVISLGGKYYKVKNQKIGNDTVKVYNNGTEHVPVPAEALANSQTKKPNQTWPSLQAQNLVKQAMQMDESGAIASYVQEKTDIGWVWDSIDPAVRFERRLEMESYAESLKDMGLTYPETLEKLKAYASNKLNPQAAEQDNKLNPKEDEQKTKLNPKEDEQKIVTVNF
jgi:hypothetical protein